jgi:hypothetical protein
MYLVKMRLEHQGKKSYPLPSLHFMDQIPSLEGHNRLASQEVSSILWNPKVITVFTRARH